VSGVEIANNSIIDDFIAPVCEGHIAILYQDDDILLINKPSGLLSLSGKNPRNWDCVHYRLVNGQRGLTAAFTQAKLPHRLDFGTSGIMVVALNDQALKHLNKQFQNATIKKHYLAVLQGSLAADQGHISAAIAKDKSIFPRVKVCQDTGKSAVTEYSVLKRLESPQRTLVQFTPLTGRTHQLRIHSQFIGHPILGCDLYHAEQSELKAERLLLHASTLCFQHPVSGINIEQHCPCPFVL
jgi:tRNA pseudouridine32 synthase/23S rRNA pseudouridine746 synthase